MSCRILTLVSPPPSPLSQNTNPIFHSQTHGFFRFSSRSITVQRCRSYLRESPSYLDLPLLPFQSDEVLVPSESKTLHLYEARFLALLEESLLKKEKIFVHFVLDQVLSGRASSGASFAARYGCLVFIEKIERLEIGALVSIRGVGRVSIVDVIQVEPYLRGVVLPMQDEVSDNEGQIQSEMEVLRESLYSLQTLQIKLKASKDELLQTQIKNSLLWAERQIHDDCDQSFIPKLAERLSFAAFQPVSGFSPSEELSLQGEKLRAMEMRDTLERLQMAAKFVKQNVAIVAAKLAIQSLGM